MKFRKKPVIVEAFQMTQEQGEGDKEQWPTWLYQAWLNKVLFYVGYGDPGVYGIKTIDGDRAVNYGDYIIQGARGELYSCGPAIFEAIYEPIEG